ncbi:MAG: DUF5606 domain-containing protein [Crocinitomicaceae bacterium]
MDIKGIIAISGKPGLYKVAAQGRNNIIVESLDTGKKFPAFSSDKISALEDICIYTYEEDVPLGDVYDKLAEKENYKASINHKEPSEKLRKQIETFLPDWDESRVHDSDLKKLFQWYNILVEKGYIVKEEKSEKESTDKKAKTDSKTKTAPKAKAKKTPAPKAAPKKNPAIKSGSKTAKAKTQTRARKKGGE